MKTQAHHILNNKPGRIAISEKSKWLPSGEKKNNEVSRPPSFTH